MVHIHGRKTASVRLIPDAPGSGPASSTSSATTTTASFCPTHTGSRNACCNATSRATLCVVSMPTPQTVQNVLMGYTQTMQTVQTPVKMELGNSPIVTLPVATTPQSMPNSPKTLKSDSKEILTVRKMMMKSQSPRKNAKILKKVKKVKNMIHQETKTLQVTRNKKLTLNLKNRSILEHMWVNQNGSNTKMVIFNCTQNGRENIFSCNAATYDSSLK